MWLRIPTKRNLGTMGPLLGEGPTSAEQQSTVEGSDEPVSALRLIPLTAAMARLEPLAADPSALSVFAAHTQHYSCDAGCVQRGKHGTTRFRSRSLYLDLSLNSD